ncbi:MAG: hypothetical protein ACYTEQ_24460, partial [Planctomycetota bacterium]|jgi:hypothetical protein
MEKRRSFLWSLKTAVLVLLWLWSIGGGPSRAQLVSGVGEESAAGELKIEGKHIRQLVLDARGDIKRFDEPGRSLRLPAGKYMLHEIHLEGGYVCYSHQIPSRKWLTVGPDDSPVLKVGAPLKHKVEVKRQGRLLVLSYELLGTGGEKYARQSRDNPPEFALYSGQEKIGDGCFEYG